MTLERRLETMRFQHEDRVRGMKTKFLKEKKAYEDSIETRIKFMAVEASKVRMYIPSMYGLCVG